MAKTGRAIWLLAMATVIAVMIGYYIWAGNVEGRKPIAARHRVVTGITYVENKPTAVIGYEIIHEGDTIDGVKVVKIHTDIVEFKKGLRRWTQRVQEKPNRAWPRVR